MKKYKLIKINGYWWTKYLFSRWCIVDTDNQKEVNLFVLTYAKEIALLKWDIIIKYNGEFNDEVEEHSLLHSLHAQCSYCQVTDMAYKNMNDDLVCRKCILKSCYNNSIFDEWNFNRITTNAQAMRNKIYKTKYIQPNTKRLKSFIL